jgi:hypothetical protein
MYNLGYCHRQLTYPLQAGDDWINPFTGKRQVLLPKAGTIISNGQMSNGPSFRTSSSPYVEDCTSGEEYFTFGTPGNPNYKLTGNGNKMTTTTSTANIFRLIDGALYNWQNQRLGPRYSSNLQKTILYLEDPTQPPATFRINCRTGTLIMDPPYPGHSGYYLDRLSGGLFKDAQPILEHIPIGGSATTGRWLIQNVNFGLPPP